MPPSPAFSLLCAPWLAPWLTSHPAWFGAQATNRQLAALTSLRTLHDNYQLWSSYALHRPAAAKTTPRREGWARACWAAAKNGVLGALHKGRVTVSSVQARARRVGP